MNYLTEGINHEKKTLSVIALFIGVFSFVAVNAAEFVGWKNSTADAQAKYTECVKAKQYEFAAILKVEIWLNENPNCTADQFISKANEIYNAERVDLSQSVRDKMFKHFVKSCSFNMKIRVHEVFNGYCLANPTDYDYHFLKNRRDQIKISDEQVVEICYARLMKTSSSQYADRYVSLMIDLLPTFDEVKAKTYLKALNRKFSPMLISDKAKWEPIIAKIRTALDTY